MLGGNCSSYAASDTTRMILKGPSFLFLIFREGRCLSQSPCKRSAETRTSSPNLNGGTIRSLLAFLACEICAAAIWSCTSLSVLLIVVLTSFAVGQCVRSLGPGFVG